MKKIYTVFFCFFLLNCTLLATQNPGFIITKDAKIITGQVANIFYSSWKSELVFINEMGRRYYFHPAVIHGFAIHKNGDMLQFESKFYKGTWRFLEVMEKGANLSLYRSPIIKTHESAQRYGEEKIVNRRVNEYWVEVGTAIPVRVYPLSYKRKLREFMSNQPQLVKKIGTTGYKFKNLQKIVEEYNELNAQNGKHI